MKLTLPHNIAQCWASFRLVVLLCLCWLPWAAQAAADLDVNTPAMQALKASMQQRHVQLLPFYQSGMVGFTSDGFVAVREASQIPLSQRPALAALVKAENLDRSTLYEGIASANGHPEWAGEIQRIFAQRWLDRAQAGWYVQKDGQWMKK